MKFAKLILACSLIALIVVPAFISAATASGVYSVGGSACDQPVLSWVGQRTIGWVPPLWEFQVEVHNAGPGTAKNVNITMYENLAWLTIPDPNCDYGDIAAGGSYWGNDTYEVDLTNNPGGGFHVWLDVVYADECGNQYRVILEPQLPLGTVSTTWGTIKSLF